MPGRPVFFVDRQARYPIHPMLEVGGPAITNAVAERHQIRMALKNAAPKDVPRPAKIPRRGAEDQDEWQ